MFHFARRAFNIPDTGITSSMCPTMQQLTQYRQGQLALDLDIMQHIAVCQVCQFRLSILRGDFQTSAELFTLQHLNDEQVAKFVTGTLTPRGMQLARRHLLRCRSCKDKVASAQLQQEDRA